MKFCVVGGLREVVLRFEFHQNRLSGFGAGGSKSALPTDLNRPLAYTTACTTVQAVTTRRLFPIVVALPIWDLTPHFLVSCQVPGPTQVLHPNCISIGSAVFAGLTTVTDHASQSVTKGRIDVRSTAMRPNNN